MLHKEPVNGDLMIDMHLYLKIWLLSSENVLFLINVPPSDHFHLSHLFLAAANVHFSPVSFAQIC